MLSFRLRRSPLMQMSYSMAKLFSSSPCLIPAALPSHRETHFWYIKPDEVKDPSLLSHYQNLLSPSEKQSVLRMKGENLQKRALLARALVRTTLSRYTDSLMTPSSFKFKKNMFGKPEVEWQVDKNPDLLSLQFNLSHTSSLIACGVTSNMGIGIDVEEKERKTMHNLLSLANRYFTSDEVEHLKKFTDSEIRSHEFIKLWTLKEAYVKALGKGFSGTPFTSFNIRVGETKIVVDVPEGLADLTTKWEFAQFELDNSHYASICTCTGEEKDYEDGMKLKVWKTLPFVHDEFVSQTELVRSIRGV